MKWTIAFIVAGLLDGLIALHLTYSFILWDVGWPARLVQWHPLERFFTLLMIVVFCIVGVALSMLAKKWLDEVATP